MSGRSDIVNRMRGAVCIAMWLVIACPVHAAPTRLTAWGQNDGGQTNVPAGITNGIAVAGGRAHSLVLCATGSVTAWGDNSLGQLNVPAGMTDIVEVASGADHSLVVRTGGKVVAWGDNGRGQTNVPASVTNAVSVRGGSEFSLALRSNGTIIGWGDNTYHQTAIPSNATSIVAIAAGGYHSVALRTNGTVVAWGYNGSGQTNVPAGLSNVIAVAAGREFSMALRANGSVVVWGQGTSGQTNVPVGLSNAVAISAGGDHCLARQADGTCVSWGDNSYNQTNVPESLNYLIVAAACGQAHSLALSDMGTLDLVVTSSRGSPSPGVGTNLVASNTVKSCSVASPVTVGGTQYVCTGWIGTGSVPANGTSNNLSVLITHNSTLTWQWQTNYYLSSWATNGGAVNHQNGWYANPSNVVLTATPDLGYAFSAWVGDTNGCSFNGVDITVPMTQARAIEARFVGSPVVVFSGPALTFTGEVYSTIASQIVLISNSWNTALSYSVQADAFWFSVSNAAGTLAAGQTTTHVVRVETRGLDARTYGGHLVVKSAAASNSPAFASVSMMLTRTQPPTRVVAWGADWDGVTTVPDDLTNVVALSGGATHALGLLSDGTVVGWGDNFFYGQTDVPVGLTNAIAVQAASGSSYALRNDGTIIGWGNDDVGQVDVPSDVTNVVAIAGKGSYVLALLANGTVRAWGGYAPSETNVPPDATNVVAISGGTGYSLALKADGTVVAWGHNSQGQLAVPPPCVTTVVAVSVGGEHALALRADGTVVAWGDNAVGQTNVPAGLTNVVAVSAGDYHSLAMRKDGSVVTWGWEGVDNNLSTLPSGLNNVAAIDASFGNVSLAVVPTMRVQLTIASEHGSPLPSVGSDWVMSGSVEACSVASPLTDGGTQRVCAGWTGTGSVPASGTSNNVSFLITTNSTLTWLWRTNYLLTATSGTGGSVSTNGGWCAAGSNVVVNATPGVGYSFGGWSGDTNGCVVSGSQITVSMTQARNVQVQFVRIPVMSIGTSVLTFTGQVHSTVSGQMVTISNSGNATLNYSIASDVFWLHVENPSGTLMAGAATTHVVNVSSLGLVALRTYIGRLNVNNLGLTGDTAVVEARLSLSPIATPTKIIGWGKGTEGQTSAPQSLTNAVALSAGRYHTVALCADGQVVAWGYNYLGITNVPSGLTNVVAISAKGVYTLALRGDGTVTAWGPGATNIPPGLSNVVSIAAGDRHGLALKMDGTVVGWGSNEQGQINIPTNLVDVVAIAGGSVHSAALKSNGRVVVWGDNSLGQTNVPQGLTNVVAIVGGEDHTSALKADGSVVVWGGREYNSANRTNWPIGPTNVPIDLTDAIGIGGEGYHALALRSDGTVATWGDDLFGQTNVPWGLAGVMDIAGGGYHSLALVSGSQCSLSVFSEQGFSSPATGRYSLVYASGITCSVPSTVDNGGTQMVCVGWIGSGNVPSNGVSNSIAFVITNDSSVAWQWRTNYFLSVSAGTGGIVDVSSGWQSSDTNVTITATASNGYTFVGWMGDTNGSTFSGTQITVPMTQARSLAALFTLQGVTLTIASDYATPSPTVGPHGYEYGATQSCTVSASLTLGSTQLLCRGFVGSGSVPAKGYSNTVSVIITNDSTLTWLWQAGTNQNLLLASNGGQLMSYTGQLSIANGATALNDGIKGKTSFWKSPTNPVGAYGFVWQFTNTGPAQLDRAVFYNYGDSGQYSKGYRLELSLDGTNYTAVTNAVLSKNEKAKTNSLTGKQARWVRLVITNGYKTKFWELSELEVYGYPGLQAIPTQSVPPTVSITSPTNGTTVVYPASITINVSASDMDGVVTQVVVFGDGSTLGTDNTSPYGGTWTTPLPGSRQLWAAAWDNEGLISTSTPIVVVVTQQVVNLLLPAHGGQLLAFTGELSSANGAAKLNDGTHGSTSFWKSPTNPVGAYGFVWRLTSTAQLDRAVFYNYGDSGQYSKGYRLEVSSDGTNYTVVTNGVLPNKEKATTNSLAGRQAGWVRLVVTNGYKTKFWELSEVEVYGLIPIGGGGGAMVVSGMDVARPVARLELKNGETTLGFDTASEQLYSVDFKASLHDEWVPIVTDQPGTSAWQVISLPATNISGFYRIRARPSP